MGAFLFSIFLLLISILLAFLDGRQIFVMQYEAKEYNSDEAGNKDDNVRWKKQLEALKSEDSIAESGRMFIRNLSYTITEDNIRQLFEKYGRWPIFMHNTIFTILIS